MTRELLSEPLPLWMDWDPARLERDRTEIEAFAPDLVYAAPRTVGFPYGGFHGTLPLWPFDRPVPEGLTDLLPAPIEVAVLYSSAHPMVPPVVVPMDPQPEIHEQSLSRWHVLPGGALCLLQSEGMWVPEASVVDLLLKACGWHVEYTLMRAGLIDEMTTSGIVSDDSRDHLVDQACATPTPEES